jgi:large subunit ribosomal protein L13
VAQSKSAARAIAKRGQTSWKKGFDRSRVSGLEYQAFRASDSLRGSRQAPQACSQGRPNRVIPVSEQASRIQKRVTASIFMKTFSAKPHEVKRDWFLVDASDKVLGRLAAEIALRLRGKHKPEYTPHVDTGDFIVVVNAGRLRVTGNKGTDKKYYRHSGYPGGISETNFSNMQARFPGRALEKAVKGMLPKGPLGYAMIKKLKVYGEGSHPHSAQQPRTLDI